MGQDNPHAPIISFSLLISSIKHEAGVLLFHLEVSRHSPPDIFLRLKSTEGKSFNLGR